ncbi:hypothetical protein CK203_066074 [Vitis vinifera]|uniref:Uncharacterized protein n=1 Tax=Vitis vinifera TaxID=29760 RepID=A0A438G2R7_VITVI|nr:hypothetical protein CK203_066074 [Vitis vinifera]
MVGILSQKVERSWSGPSRRLKGNQSSRGSAEGEGGPKMEPKGGVSCKDSFANEAWVRVVRLPLHLWSLGSDLGEACGGVAGRNYKEGVSRKRKKRGEVHALLALGVKGRRVQRGGVGHGPWPKVLAQRRRDLIGPESSVPFFRALDEFLLSKAREESGDEDPLVGLTRAALSLEALEVVERASLTNKALFVEASKYVETLSFSVGGRELSFLLILLISFEL